MTEDLEAEAGAHGDTMGRAPTADEMHREESRHQERMNEELDTMMGDQQRMRHMMPEGMCR